MSNSTKKHYYPFILRSSAYAGLSSCQDKVVFYLIPPENALTVEQMFIHLKGTFDASVAVGDRLVVYIGVGSTFGPITVDPADLKKITLNQAADGSRKVDIRLNVTTLVNKLYAGYRDNLGSITTGTPTYIYLKLADNLRNTSGLFIIDLWKMDGLYTIKKIP